MKITVFLCEYVEAAEDRNEEQKRLKSEMAKQRAATGMRRKRHR